MDGWVDGWMGGCQSRVKDCLQQSKIMERQNEINRAKKENETRRQNEWKETERDRETTFYSIYLDVDCFLSHSQ